MGDALAAIGIPGVYEGALCFVTNPSLISRAHFGRYLAVSYTHLDVYKRQARGVARSLR